MSRKFGDLSDADLQLELRRVAAVWLKNDDVLLLEELFYRHTLLINRAQRFPSLPSEPT